MSKTTFDQKLQPDFMNTKKYGLDTRKLTMSYLIFSMRIQNSTVSYLLR